MLRSALKAHETIKMQVAQGKRPLYRHKKWKQKERMKEKRGRKMNWYNKRKKQDNEEERPTAKRYKSVLFVQPTYDSALKKRYEEVIERSKCRVKVVERAGENIKQKLQKSYPFDRKICDAKDCFVCGSGGKGNCKRKNVCYKSALQTVYFYFPGKSH